jgi:uncharacterized 2Fe-2S/4Fe-4S cluster protein (DUF4445 family)
MTLLEAARLVSEPLAAECSGRGACGMCLVQILEGDVAEHRVLRREAGTPQVLACQTVVQGPLNLEVLAEARLPDLITRDNAVGVAPLEAWAPWPLDLDPVVELKGSSDLGVALDVGTTTIRLVLIRLCDGVVVGEAATYNPQISWGALDALTSLARGTVTRMIVSAAGQTQTDLDSIRAYSVAGNLTMIHLLLGVDPSGIRRVPSEPAALAFAPVEAASLSWPGRGEVMVHTVPAAGGWVGGDIVAGVARIGFPRREQGLALYVDLGTNGEIALGGADFAMACACSAGPAFEGGGIQCGMRADQGAVDGATIDEQKRTLELSVIGGGAVRGVCGSGLIALADALFRAGWIDRRAQFTDELPTCYRLRGKLGRALLLADEWGVALWERDLASLVRAKAAVFSGIRTLMNHLGIQVDQLERVIVSGNFGRFLNLPAAAGIGLLPGLPPARYVYVDNGSLEGAALSLLSRDFGREVRGYLDRITYVNLSEIPGYMDEFVAASFLPHTDPVVLGK